MPTALIGAGSPGAGRSYDGAWPRGGATIGYSIPRGGIDQNAGVSIGSTVTGPTRYRGRMCYATASTAAVGGTVSWNQYIPQPMTVKSTANLSGSDDALCFRYMFLMAFDDCVDIGTLDCGAYVCAGATVSLLQGNSCPGFGFQRKATNDLRLLIKTTAIAAFAVNLPIAGIITADWNAYEFRWIGPTKLSEGQLKCYINGVNVGNYLHGAGSVLPDGERAGPSYGWCPFLANWQNAIASQTAYYGGMRVIAGPTESSLL